MAGSPDGKFQVKLLGTGVLPDGFDEPLRLREVRLAGAYLVRCTEVVRGAGGEVVEVNTADLRRRSAFAQRQGKTQRELDRLFRQAKVDAIQVRTDQPYDRNGELAAKGVLDAIDHLLA